MPEIFAMPSHGDQELLGRMRDVETATVGHILHHGFVEPAISAVSKGNRVAGFAFTVRIPGADSTMLHHAINLARPGDVIMVDRCGDKRHACIGGVTANAAALAGVAAVVIDGPATDFAEIRACGLPVWCRGETSLTTKFLNLESAINVPVSVGGVAVCPGDLVLADDCGVVIISPERADRVARQAIGMQKNEFKVLARLRAGESLDEISGARSLIKERLGAQNIGN